MQSGWKIPSQPLTQSEMEAWKAQLDDVAEQYKGLLEDLLQRIVPSEAADSVYRDMRESFEAAAQSLMSNPNLLWQTQSRLIQDQWLLWQQGLRAMAGQAVHQVLPLGLQRTPHDFRVGGYEVGGRHGADHLTRIERQVALVGGVQPVQAVDQLLDQQLDQRQKQLQEAEAKRSAEIAAADARTSAGRHDATASCTSSLGVRSADKRRSTTRRTCALSAGR